MRDPKLTKFISVRMPPEMHKALKHLAIADDRSLDGYIRRVLSEHVRKASLNESQPNPVSIPPISVSVSGRALSSQQKFNPDDYRTVSE